MKKWFLVALLLLPLTVGANDMKFTIDYTVVAADTGIGSSIIDTAYSDWYRCDSYRWLQFATEVRASGNANMFAFTADTFHFNIQTSANKSDIVSTIAVDTLLGVSHGVSVVNIDADATVFGTWMRGQVIYKDSVLASIDTALGNVYKADLIIWDMSK